jgi:BlaI family transcriptional regulator, penicillinase repressor
MARKPTGLELEILRRLWELGNEGTVHDVLRIWGKGRVPGYTTVLKTLQIMESKGLVSHTRKGRSFTYRAVLVREEATSARLEELLHGFYRGDRLGLVSRLIDEMDLTTEDIKEIRRMLKGKEKGT